MSEAVAPAPPATAPATAPTGPKPLEGGALWLAAFGLAPGDRVAVLAQNCPEYMEAYAAAEIGGWATVTVNYRLSPDEIAYILADSAPKGLIVEQELLGEAAGPGVAYQAGQEIGRT